MSKDPSIGDSNRDDGCTLFEIEIIGAHKGDRGRVLHDRACKRQQPKREFLMRVHAHMKPRKVTEGETQLSCKGQAGFTVVARQTTR